MRQINTLLSILFIILLVSESSLAQENVNKKIGPCIHEKQSPSPQNGMEELVEWIKENNTLKPEQTTTPGRVFVKFSVDTDGSIYDVKIAKGLTEATNKEALRIISSMPKWIPAEESSEQCFMVLPILFPNPKTVSTGR